MLKYLSRRLLQMIPLLIGITIISFAVIHLAPGEPTDLVTDLQPKVSAQAAERLKTLYGLDRPLHIQYL
ncbi:diguanylate cyclase, partial [bacterium]|nr:diguanylate cyclase [bacterium]